MAKEGITPRAQDYSQWYLDIVREADMAEVAEVVRDRRRDLHPYHLIASRLKASKLTHEFLHVDGKIDGDLGVRLLPAPPERGRGGVAFDPTPGFMPAYRP